MTRVYRESCVLAALCLLPTITLAQRGGGTRTRADKHTPMFDKEAMPKGPSLRVRDVEDMSPVKRLIDKRRGLKLTDARFTQLKDAEIKLKQTNEPLLKLVDSLLHEAKQAASNASSEEGRARAAQAARAVRSTVEQIGGNYDAAASEATATFDAEQQAKAREILAKLKEDNDNMLRERLEGRRG